MEKNSLLNLKASLAKPSSPIVVVTGATGWVGKSCLHELQKLIPADLFNSKVIVFASAEKTIVSTGYENQPQIEIPVHALSDIVRCVQNKNIALFHAAFLTKDRIRAYGEADFIATNKYITANICNALQVVQSARIIAISSGAAAECEKRNEMNLSSSLDIYGYLKLREEMELSRMAPTQVLRIYALSGRFVRDPASFALGDFLLSALQKNRIHVRSATPVIRGYVNASDVARSAISWLVSDDPVSSPIAAVSEIITLESLSALISTIYGLQPPIVHKLEGQPSSYSYSPVNFLNLCRRYGVSPISLRDQIVDTAKGVT